MRNIIGLLLLLLLGSAIAQDVINPQTDASRLTTGTLPSARLVGAYTSMTGIRSLTAPAGSGVILSTVGAVLSALPSDPTGTTSTAAFKMMGVGGTCAITPVASTRMLITISGNVSNSTATAGATIDVQYGTGTAPTNGAALTGTQLAGTPTFSLSLTNQRVPFSITGIASGLTLATAYWIDMAVIATAGTASVGNLTCVANEI